jgi:hypothetical protein
MLSWLGQIRGAHRHYNATYFFAHFGLYTRNERAVLQNKACSAVLPTHAQATRLFGDLMYLGMGSRRCGYGPLMVD